MQDKINEAGYWREAYAKERDARALSENQTKDLLAGLKTNHEIITAMFKNIEQISQSGATDVAKEKS